MAESEPKQNYRNWNNYKEATIDQKTLNVECAELTTDVDLYGYREKNEIRLVLLGKTGSGKSATGNYIMGQKYFVSKLAGKSITKTCLTGTSRHAERKLVIVDTPGLFDTELSQEEVRQEIIKCIHNSIPGPHIFLLTVSIGRFTEEEIQTFYQLFDMFGEHMGNYAIIGFTRLDDIKRDGSTIEEFIESSDTLTTFVRHCNGRYFAFDNTELLKEERTTEIEKLVRLIDAIVQANGGKYYSNEMYRQAEKQFQLKVQEAERQKAEEKQREIENIESMFAKQINDTHQRNEELARQIADQELLQKQIRDDKDRVVLELHNMKEEMKSINEKTQRALFEATQRAAKEKELYLADLKKKEEQNDAILEEISEMRSDFINQINQIEQQKHEAIKQVKIEQETIFDEKMKRIIDENKNQRDWLEKKFENDKTEMRNEFMEQNRQNDIKLHQFISTLEERTKQLQQSERDKIETQNRFLEHSRLTEERHQRILEENRNQREQFLSALGEKVQQFESYRIETNNRLTEQSRLNLQAQREKEESVNSLMEQNRLLIDKLNNNRSSCTIL